MAIGPETSKPTAMTASWTTTETPGAHRQRADGSRPSGSSRTSEDGRTKTALAPFRREASAAAAGLAGASLKCHHIDREASADEQHQPPDGMARRAPATSAPTTTNNSG